MTDVVIGLAHACEVANDTGSNESLAFAKRCILSCQEHAICAVDRPPFRPTRVLDVKKLPSASNAIRLVETTDLPASPLLPYIALSHCWGGKIDYKLLESNREDMKRQIDFSSLARNFRDAISITRPLGERYLWIDSLCIIQDSLSDWERESSQMGQLTPIQHAQYQPQRRGTPRVVVYYPKSYFSMTVSCANMTNIH